MSSRASSKHTEQKTIKSSEVQCISSVIFAVLILDVIDAQDFLYVVTDNLNVPSMKTANFSSFTRAHAHCGDEMSMEVVVDGNLDGSESVLQAWLNSW